MYFLIPIIAVIAASLVGIYTDPHLIDPILKKTWRRTIDLNNEHNRKPQPRHKRAWSYILAKSRTMKSVLTRAGLERTLKEIKVWESRILKSKVWKHVERFFLNLTSSLTRYHLIFLIAALGIGVLFMFIKRRKRGSAYTEEIYTENTDYISEYEEEGYMSSADLEPRDNIEEANTYFDEGEREEKEQIEVAIYETRQYEEDEREEKIFSEPEEQEGPTSDPIISTGDLGAEESSEPPAWRTSSEQEEHEDYATEPMISESYENVYDAEYGEDTTDPEISHGDQGERAGEFLLGYEHQVPKEEISPSPTDTTRIPSDTGDLVLVQPELTEDFTAQGRRRNRARDPGMTPEEFKTMLMGHYSMDAHIENSPTLDSRESITNIPRTTDTTALAATSAEFPGAYNPRPQWKARELYFGPYWDGLVCIWKGPWPAWRGPPLGYDDSFMYIQKSSSRKIRSAEDDDQKYVYRPEWEGPNFHIDKHSMYTMGGSPTRDLGAKIQGTEQGLI